MNALLIIIVAVLLIALVFLLFRVLGNKKEDKEAALRDRAYAPRDPFSTADDDAVRGNPRTLKPGDLVEIRGQSYFVRGTLMLEQSGFRWTENFLDTGVGVKGWISVEEDPDLEVVLWSELQGVTITPGAPTIELEGRSYRFDESGNARFTSMGTTGLTTGVMAYQDYEAGNDRLSFEDYGSGWECARGQVLSRAEYRIFPAGSTPEGSV
ncbi:DUF4178 domain-containing protein [Williamsia sp. CHRR-6]|uniref:DUF4178 domain-containing protein n=1 Tax=Williamsia sp. CHRR-6 TaxID=2835871 RepID=UPI001BDAA84F|nr:DUF4178 domain-containing protein [Williamsia sp. CHRR-6]MBT0567001.1 DUF4178 domain-containing protein [Williamsia sp. CHRR-6]